MRNAYLNSRQDELGQEPLERFDERYDEIRARISKLAGLDEDALDGDSDVQRDLIHVIVRIREAAGKLDAAIMLRRIDRVTRRPNEEWRAKLRELRDGRLEFSEAVGDARVRIALRHGVRKANLWRALAPRWLHALRDDRRSLRLSLEATLRDEYLMEMRGAPDQTYRVEFVRAISDACQDFIGQPLRRSVTWATGKPSGPGIGLVRACIEPLVGGITDEAIAHLIREARK